MIIDSCAFTGHWPFRRLYKPSLADLAAENARNGITRSVVSCLDSIFYNDPNEGDELLAQALPPEHLLAISHNPLLPYVEQDVAENRLFAKALRLYPSYHRYTLDDPCVQALCEIAAEQSLPIYVMMKLDDVRMDYIVRQQVPSVADVVSLAARVPEATFIASGIAITETIANHQLLLPQENLYVDTAYCGNLSFPYERLLEVFPAKRILFSTHAPLLCPDANRMALEIADIPASAREAIFSDNAVRLFDL